jgi:hypothetical protein
MSVGARELNPGAGDHKGPHPYGHEATFPNNLPVQALVVALGWDLTPCHLNLMPMRATTRVPTPTGGGNASSGATSFRPYHPCHPCLLAWQELLPLVNR